MAQNPFDRSGIAAHHDLKSDEWRELFAILEREQSEFLAQEQYFRSPEYAWPRDALHSWSRQWEYPYAYYHLRSLRSRFPAAPLPRVVDLGSGVTFFPFTVARLGYHVTCADSDPVCGKDIPRAASVMRVSPGIVDCEVAGAERLPFRDREIDAVYCVSVLEHAKDYGVIIGEITRILKPGGVLIMTFDLDLRGDSEIGVERFLLLKSALAERFSLAFPAATIHPADMLRTDNVPYGFPRISSLRRLRIFLKAKARTIQGKSPLRYPPYVLAVEGGVYELDRP